MIRITLVFAFVFLLLAPAANATALAPCTDAGTMDIIPLSSGLGTYCVSDYGWTDTWFVGTSPSAYDPRFDVFSGDDSPNLHFGILGGADWREASGFGWLSPIMDEGTAMPTFPTGSPWMVLTPVHYTGLTTAESIILHPLGMEARIVTSLNPITQEVTQTFTFTNTTSDATFIDVLFADYFNYHPNGTTPENMVKGTATYAPLTGITITGIDDGSLIATGSMRGERVDDAHGRSSVFITTDMVQTVDYMDPGTGVAVGPGDVAGGLAWELPDLKPGEFVSFSIFKNSVPLETPEPSALLLLILPLTGLVLGRSRKL